MSRIKKRIEKWRNPRFKQTVPINDLIAVLDYYFPNSYEIGGRRGSHIIRIQHDLLKGNSDFGPEGVFTIPTTGGKHVKHFYLKELTKIIDLIYGDEE